MRTGVRGLTGLFHPTASIVNPAIVAEEEMR